MTNKSKNIPEVNSHKDEGYRYEFGGFVYEVKNGETKLIGRATVSRRDVIAISCIVCVSISALISIITSFVNFF